MAGDERAESDIGRIQSYRAVGGGGHCSPLGVGPIAHPGDWSDTSIELPSAELDGTNHVGVAAFRAAWFGATDECFELDGSFPFEPVSYSPAGFVVRVLLFPDGAFAASGENLFMDRKFALGGGGGHVQESVVCSGQDVDKEVEPVAQRRVADVCPVEAQEVEGMELQVGIVLLLDRACVCGVRRQNSGCRLQRVGCDGVAGVEIWDGANEFTV